MPQVPPDVVKEGVCMDRIIKDVVSYAAKGSSLPRDSNKPLVLSYATACSGSEIVHICLDFLERHLGDAGVHMRFQQAFSCENVKRKRDFGAEVVRRSNFASSANTVSASVHKDLTLARSHSHENRLLTSTS